MKPLLGSPAYIFREGEEPIAYQYWPSDEESQLFCSDCANTPSECEFPLYADDLQAMIGIDPALIACDRCNKIVAEATPRAMEGE